MRGDARAAAASYNNPTQHPTPEAQHTNTPHTLTPMSQFFSQSYESNLPTSLVCVVLSDQRLFTSETCCGFEYDWMGRSRLYFVPSANFTDEARGCLQEVEEPLS